MSTGPVYSNVERHDSFPSIALEYDENLRQRYADKDPNEWGSEPDEVFTHPSFVWDIEPERFYWSSNRVDNVLVHPPVYEDALKGFGVRVNAPLKKEEDLEDLAEVLEEDALEENLVMNDWDDYDDAQYFDFLNTPLDTAVMHGKAWEHGIPVHVPRGAGKGMHVSVDDHSRYDADWLEGAREKTLDWMEASTEKLPANHQFTNRDLAEAARDLDGTTAVVTFDQGLTKTINDVNGGSLAYYTPALMNMVFDAQD